MMRSGRHGLGGYGGYLSELNQREEDRRNGVVRKTALESALDWVTHHKPAAAGGLCAAGVGGAVAYKLSRPGIKPAQAIAHACRLTARRCAPFAAIALAGAGLSAFYKSESGLRSYHYAKQYVSSDVNSNKNSGREKKYRLYS